METILDTIQAALRGSRKIRMTFKQRSISDIAYLLAMNGKIIKLSTGDEMALLAVRMTNDWGADRNRTITITLTDNFDENWFVGRMERAVDKIVVA